MREQVISTWFSPRDELDSSTCKLTEPMGKLDRFGTCHTQSRHLKANTEYLHTSTGNVLCIASFGSSRPVQYSKGSKSTSVDCDHGIIFGRWSCLTTEGITDKRTGIFQVRSSTHVETLSTEVSIPLRGFIDSHAYVSVVALKREDHTAYCSIHGSLPFAYPD